MSYESDYTKLNSFKCEPNNFKYGKQQNEIKEGYQSEYRTINKMKCDTNFKYNNTNRKIPSFSRNGSDENKILN